MRWIDGDVTSKRRKGYPSETRVKRGERIVHGKKELIEKLGSGTAGLPFCASLQLPVWPIVIANGSEDRVMGLWR